MNHQDRERIPKDLVRISELLRNERPEAGPLELDRIKLRAKLQPKAARRSQILLSGKGYGFMRSRLIGLIIAMVVNMFLKSSGLDFIISAAGVLIFAGLTAWDTQRIKEMYDPMEDGTLVGRKAVMGALTLYLDFINLFLFMLRFFGDRR